jgi:hypothetical protein
MRNPNGRNRSGFAISTGVHAAPGVAAPCRDDYNLEQHVPVRWRSALHPPPILEGGLLFIVCAKLGTVEFAARRTPTPVNVVISYLERLAAKGAGGGRIVGWKSVDHRTPTGTRAVAGGALDRPGLTSLHNITSYV